MRQNEANKDIRQAAQNAGVFLWRVADALGISDRTLCVQMRRELPDETKARILSIIRDLAAKC